MAEEKNHIHYPDEMMLAPCGGVLLDSDVFEIKEVEAREYVSIKGGGSLNIKFKKESASGLYECDKSFEDIKQAIIDFKDINIEFPNEDGTVSYDKWYVKATDNSTTITFASGRYENTLLNERCWIEENVVMPSTYVSGASLALAQNIVYSRDYKIKYDVNDDDYEGAWPSPRLASEIKPFHGDFQFVPADNVTPTGTAGGKAFQGWFYDEGCTTKINFGDVAGVDPDAITHDVRAYAKWEAAAVDVTYMVFTTYDGDEYYDDVYTITKPSGTSVDYGDGLSGKMPTALDTLEIYNKIRADHPDISHGVETLTVSAWDENPHVLTVDDIGYGVLLTFVEA